MSPLFWQALGKQQGWGKDPHWGKVGRDGYANVWQSYWHDFIDHIAEGGDIDEFFNNLLN